MKTLRKFLGDSRGANAVEFALLAGPFLLVLVGTVEFGRAFWSRQVVQEVAIAGARCVAVPQPSCMAAGKYDATAARQYIMTSASSKGVALTQPNVTLDRNATCFGTSGFSQVTIAYTFSTALPDFITALASGAVMNATSCFPTQGA